MESYKEWLAHHGIPGMHWGERNGPPYPLRPMQYTKEELREKKKAVKSYNKELSKAQNLKYRRADTIVSNASQKFKNKADKIQRKRDTGKISDEEAKARAVKIGQKYADWSVNHAKQINTVLEGNKKVLDILDRAEKEGGLQLNAVTEYTSSFGKSVLANLATYGVLNSVLLPATGFVVYPIIPMRIPNAEKTDRYSLSVSKEYKNEVKRQKRQGSSSNDTKLPDNVSSEVWKGVAKKVEGRKSVSVEEMNKLASDVAKELMEDKNSEYYKWANGK